MTKTKIKKREREKKGIPASVCCATTRFLMLVQKRHPGEGFGAVLALVFFHIGMGL